MTVPLPKGAFNDFSYKWRSNSSSRSEGQGFAGYQRRSSVVSILVMTQAKNLQATKGGKGFYVVVNIKVYPGTVLN